jgi:hypothetical protein
MGVLLLGNIHITVMHNKRLALHAVLVQNAYLEIAEDQTVVL